MTELTGRHILFAFIGFFGVIFLVNGYFLYSALRTYTGVVADEPYRKGLEYNKRIDAERRQTALGWQHDVVLEKSGELRVSVRDQSGAPVGALMIEASLGRPSTRAYDVRLDLVDSGPGEYSATAAPLEAGNWVVGLDIKRQSATSADQQETVYRAKERLWLRP